MIGWTIGGRIHRNNQMLGRSSSEHYVCIRPHNLGVQWDPGWRLGFKSHPFSYGIQNGGRDLVSHFKRQGSRCISHILQTKFQFQRAERIIHSHSVLRENLTPYRSSTAVHLIKQMWDDATTLIKDLANAWMWTFCLHVRNMDKTGLNKFDFNWGHYTISYFTRRGAQNASFTS